MLLINLFFKPLYVDLCDYSIFHMHIQHMVLFVDKETFAGGRSTLVFVAVSVFETTRKHHCANLSNSICMVFFHNWNWPISGVLLLFPLSSGRFGDKLRKRNFGTLWDIVLYHAPGSCRGRRMLSVVTVFITKNNGEHIFEKMVTSVSLSPFQLCTLPAKSLDTSHSRCTSDPSRFVEYNGKARQNKPPLP